MLHKFLAALAVGAMIAAVSVPTADAAKKKKRLRPAAPATPSLDGRITGYPRSCGSDFIRYGGDGVPVGPYCH
jgi:hypothetical protein